MRRISFLICGLGALLYSASCNAQIKLTKNSDTSKVITIDRVDHLAISCFAFNKNGKLRRKGTEGTVISYSEDSLLIDKTLSKKIIKISYSEIYAITKINQKIRLIEYTVYGATFLFTYFHSAYVLLGLPRGSWYAIIGFGLVEKLLHPYAIIGGEKPRWQLEVKG